MPRLDATYPMTLNFKTYLKKKFELFYSASIPVNLLKWTKYQQNFGGAEVLTVLKY